MFIEAKDDGSGGDYWSYKSCKAPVKSSSPTNQHQTFYRPDALPVAQPTVSKHWREIIDDNWWYLYHCIQLHDDHISVQWCHLANKIYILFLKISDDAVTARCLLKCEELFLNIYKNRSTWWYSFFSNFLILTTTVQFIKRIYRHKVIIFMLTMSNVNQTRQQNLFCCLHLVCSCCFFYYV